MENSDQDRMRQRCMGLDMNHCDKEFNEIISESIDDAFSTLGESAKTSIYFHLEKEFMISKHEIPRRIEDFSDALEHIFGIGARHLEILIMKNLNQKTGYQSKADNSNWLASELTLTKYVKRVRFRCEDSDNVDFAVIMNAEEQATITNEIKRKI